MSDENWILERLRAQRPSISGAVYLDEEFVKRAASHVEEAADRIAKLEAALNLIVSMEPAPMTLAYDMAKIARDTLKDIS